MRVNKHIIIIIIKSIDTILNWYIRLVLKINPNTSNIITTGECGIIPPSVKAHQRIILYYIRLNQLPEGSILKNVFNDLRNLSLSGFKNWVSDVQDLAQSYNLDINSFKYSEKTKHDIKSLIRSSYVNNWFSNLSNIDKHPILRTYKTLKFDYTCEPYLLNVAKPKYRIAISKLRSSSHLLEVERGRHTKPKIILEKRNCSVCGTLEDEYHFLILCGSYENERRELFQKVKGIDVYFDSLSSMDKFVYLLTINSSRISTWVGKFIHEAMEKRSTR